MKNINFWQNKRILITGGCGFLGRHLISNIKGKTRTSDLIIIQRKDFDLRKEKNIERLFKQHKNIDIIIHLAADVGGIAYNRKFQGEVFYNNLIMNTLLMEYSRLNKIGKFVGTGTVCSYPKFTPVPFVEKNLWLGYPEETNAPYGLAKKMMIVQGEAYKKQFNFNSIHLLMINLYGPGDNFDKEDSHVISGLVRKFMEAKLKGLKEVVAWGTGKATREFLFVEDAAEAITLATERYDKPEPVNIGSGREISIKDLAYLIAELSGFKGVIRWDKSKPDGQPKRRLDNNLAETEFDFRASTSLEEGLKKTISWYRKNMEGK